MSLGEMTPFSFHQADMSTVDGQDIQPSRSIQGSMVQITSTAYFGLIDVVIILSVLLSLAIGLLLWIHLRRKKENDCIDIEKEARPAMDNQPSTKTEQFRFSGDDDTIHYLANFPRPIPRLEFSDADEDFFYSAEKVHGLDKSPQSQVMIREITGVLPPSSNLLSPEPLDLEDSPTPSNPMSFEDKTAHVKSDTTTIRGRSRTIIGSATGQ